MGSRAKALQAQSMNMPLNGSVPISEVFSKYWPAIFAFLIGFVAVITTMIVTRQHTDEIRDIKSEMKSMRESQIRQDERIILLLQKIDKKL